MTEQSKNLENLFFPKMVAYKLNIEDGKTVFDYLTKSNRTKLKKSLEL
jgi:hypothetical protein